MNRNPIFAVVFDFRQSLVSGMFSLALMMIRYNTILYHIPNKKCGRLYRFQPCLIFFFHLRQVDSEGLPVLIAVLFPDVQMAFL